MPEQTRDEIKSKLTRAVHTGLPVDLVGRINDEEKTLRSVRVLRFEVSLSGPRISGLATVVTPDNCNLLIRLEEIVSVATYIIVPELEEREWRVIVRTSTKGEAALRAGSESRAKARAERERLDYPDCEVFIESRRVGPWEKTDG